MMEGCECVREREREKERKREREREKQAGSRFSSPSESSRAVVRVTVDSRYKQNIKDLGKVSIIREVRLYIVV